MFEHSRKKEPGLLHVALIAAVIMVEVVFMEKTLAKKSSEVLLVNRPAKKAPRPRSMTTLKMEWLAERVRKCRRIKEEIEAGTYRVDSRDVAKAILKYRHSDRKEESEV